MMLALSSKKLLRHAGKGAGKGAAPHADIFVARRCSPYGIGLRMGSLGVEEGEVMQRKTVFSACLAVTKKCIVDL